MTLKLLFFPTLLILAVFLSIAYIKPDIENILIKREEEATKQEALRSAENIESNIRSLAQALNGKKDIETLVNRYLPTSIDQERSLDVVNFLAQQTGVAVNGIAMKEKQETQTAVVVSETGEADPNQVAVTERGPESPKSYLATIEVMGTYQNLRAFLDRLYHTDRMRALNSLLIRKPDDSERFQAEQEIIPADFLRANIELDFFYASPVSGGNGLVQPIFQKNTMDFSPANRLVDFVNSPVGDLTPGNYGRTNPFEAIP